MGGNKETLVPHLVATLIYLSQIYLYYIRGDRPPLKIINIIIITIIIKKGILIYIHVLSCQGLQCGYNDLDLVLQSKQGGWGLIWKQTVKFQHWYGSSDIYTFYITNKCGGTYGMGCCMMNGMLREPAVWDYPHFVSSRHRRRVKIYIFV